MPPPPIPTQTKSTQTPSRNRPISTNASHCIQSTHRPKFRSYQPHDEQLKENAIVAVTAPADIESAVQSQLELLQTPIVIDEIDIANLAPRKPDWDLKRDVSKKLEKLEHRTQRAIAELIRERLHRNQENALEGVNVAAVVAASATESKLVVEAED